MGYNYVIDPIILIIDSIFSLYILAIVLRFMLQWCGADYYNPISQFLVKITHPPLRILRRFIPPIGKIDTSSIVLVVALQMLADFSVLLLKGVSIGVGALAILALTQLITLLINIYIFSVIGQAILSWFNPGSFSAGASILYSITAPLLNLCRRFVPDLGGLDLSPVLALLFLQLAKMIILPPLHELASLIG
ncbi:MAG: YggT family protein [Methylococcaceae bacterium]|jgi:YggT family protein